MALKIPYAENSKSYRIAQRMLRDGLPKDGNGENEYIREISSDLGVAEKSVRNVKSNLKGHNMLRFRGDPEVTIFPAAPQNPQNSSLDTAKNVGRDVPQGQNLREGDGGEDTGVPRDAGGAPRDAAERYLKEIAAMRDEVGTLKKMFAEKLNDDGDGEKAEDIKIDSGSMVARQLFLTPKTLMLFDIAAADGYPGDLSSYINDVVSKFYIKRGLTLGLIEKREL